MMIKVQTGEYKWMLLSLFLPPLIGFTVSTIVFSIGITFNLKGIELMSIAYFSGLALLLFLGFKDSPETAQPARRNSNKKYLGENEGVKQTV